MSYKILIILVSIVTVILAAFTIDIYFDNKEIQDRQEAYAKLIPQIHIEKSDTVYNHADKIRTFVFNNTIFGEGKEFRKIWGNHKEISDKIYSYASKQSKKPPPLECSARTSVMENLLQILGYDTRSIDVHAFGEDYESHSFLEVKDPKTGKWHAQDPQFNVYWRDRLTKERLGIRDLVERSQDSYEPCQNNTNCGWTLQNREGHDLLDLKKRFGLAVAIDRKHGKRPLFVNKERFDLNTPQKVGDKNLTYCEYRNKNCKDKIFKFLRTK